MTWDIRGKTVLITGATNGIGKVTALELAKAGASVIVVGRSQERADATIREIRAASPGSDIRAMLADLSSQASIRQLADTFLSEYNRLDVLINNAGAIFGSRQTTVDGNEMTLALNHLGYFLLTHLLLPPLERAAEIAGEARIINVASDAHHFTGQLNFDNLQSKGLFLGFFAYNRSKLMNVLFSYELARRLANTNITVNALHPGMIASGFARNNLDLYGLMWRLITPVMLTPEQGAQTSIYLATAPELSGRTGGYYSNSQLTRTSSVSYDEAAQRRLWSLSEKLVGIDQEREVEVIS